MKNSRCCKINSEIVGGKKKLRLNVARDYLNMIRNQSPLFLVEYVISATTKSWSSDKIMMTFRSTMKELCIMNEL